MTASIPINELNAYSMAQIMQSYNAYNDAFNAPRDRNSRNQPMGKPFKLTPDYLIRKQYKAGKNYGIEDEYRYMMAQKGFVGERAYAKEEEEVVEEETVEEATPPVIDNVYNDEINNTTVSAPAAKDFITKYGGNTDTMAHSGLSAVKAAEAAGLSIAQIQQMGIDQGISFGSGAQTYFNQQRQKSFNDQLEKIQQQNAANLKQLTIDQNTRLDKMAADQQRRSDELAAGQRTYQQNQARSGQLGALQIGGAAETPRTGGTQGFKRRKLQINPVTANALSGILGATAALTKTNVLNV